MKHTSTLMLRLTFVYLREFAPEFKKIQKLIKHMSYHILIVAM